MSDVTQMCGFDRLTDGDQDTLTATLLDVLAAHDKETAATALEEAADRWGSFEPTWRHSQLDYWLRARAVSYRKESK